MPFTSPRFSGPAFASHRPAPTRTRPSSRRRRDCKPAIERMEDRVLLDAGVPASSPNAIPAWPQIALSAPIGVFSEPVDVANAGDGSRRLFVVELTGQIRIIKDGSVLSTPFLDLTDRLDGGDGRKRLLGIAFPPD